MYKPRSLSLIRIAVAKVTTPCYNGRIYSQSPNDNEDIIPDFINRNPRNMELLRLARKPQGYCLDVPTNKYYYRLNFESSQNHVTGLVEHNSGRVVVSASTKEWCIRKHLYSSVDVASAQNIGRILARRCLQAGILEVHTDLENLVYRSRKIQIFLEAVKDGGLTLEEVPHIREHDTYIFRPKAPTYPWEVTEEYVNRMDELYPPETLNKDELHPPR